MSSARLYFVNLFTRRSYHDSSYHDTITITFYCHRVIMWHFDLGRYVICRRVYLYAKSRVPFTIRFGDDYYTILWDGRRMVSVFSSSSLVEILDIILSEKWRYRAKHVTIFSSYRAEIFRRQINDLYNESIGNQLTSENLNPPLVCLWPVTKYYLLNVFITSFPFMRSMSIRHFPNFHQFVYGSKNNWKWYYTSCNKMNDRIRVVIQYFVAKLSNDMVFTSDISYVP